ncbi:15135_t:CDS:2, partial [Funneliformis mosseae]
MTSTPFSNLHSRITLSQGRSNQFRSALPKTPRSLVKTTQRPVLKPKRRFVINKVILNNFKSYFGQTEIGPFHKKLDKETNESLTELANYEQEDIDLEERKKHAISKQKKVTMAIST